MQSELPYRDLRLKRDAAVKEQYQKLCEEHPHQDDDFIYHLLQERFFIQYRTIFAILSGEYDRNLERKLQGDPVDEDQFSLFDEPGFLHED